MADQGLCSLTNLLLALFVARQSSQSDFGSFALAVSIYILTVLLARAICGQALLIAFGQQSGADERKAMVGPFLGLGSVIGGIGVVACGVTALSSGGPLRQDVLAVAFVIVPLVVQDVARYVFFALDEPRKAFETDVTWLIMQCILTLVAVNLGGVPVAPALIAAWGIAGVVAGAQAGFRLRIRPMPMAGIGTFWLNRRLISQFALELLALSGGTQLLLYAVAAIVGRSEVAGLRGATVLLGPVTLLFSAARSGLLAHAARTAHGSRDRLRAECRRISIVLGGIVCLVGAIVVVLPKKLGEFLMGPTWVLTEPLLPAFALQFAILAFAEGSGIGLRALGASRDLLQVALYYACLSLCMGVAGAYFFGAKGAAWGNGGAAFVVLLGNTLSLRLRLKKQSLLDEAT